MSVKVVGAHEARLGRMCVYPANRDELFSRVKIYQACVVFRLTGVRGAPLFWYNQASNEECVVNDGAAKETAHLNVLAQVGGGDFQEL